MKIVKILLDLIDTTLAFLIKMLNKGLNNYITFAEEHPWALIPVIFIACIKDIN